jgi:hypothetical protein
VKTSDNNALKFALSVMGKPSKKPKNIPSPVQARQGVFLLGPVQERLECENVICNFEEQIDISEFFRLFLLHFIIEKSEHKVFYITGG